MKIYTILSALIIPSVLLLSACKSDKEQPEEKTEQKHTVDTTEKKESKKKKRAASPHKSVNGTIAGCDIVVEFGSPSVKERKIWGGLEDYDVVWRAGADETTSMSFSTDVQLNGETIPAGKYGFFIIPKESGDWVAIFNEAWSREEHNAWGAYNYEEEKDVLRLNVTPEWTEDIQETLEYAVEDDHIQFMWEKVQLRIDVTAAE